MFQYYIKKQIKNFILLQEFPGTSTQIRLIMNALFSSQFGYCLLYWMFHNRSLNNRINRLQERALSLMYKGTTDSVVELLEKENTFTIHQRNIKKLTIEIFKVKHKEAPKLMCERFQETEHPYNLRNNHTIKSYSDKMGLKMKMGLQHGTENCHLWGLIYGLLFLLT